MRPGDEVIATFPGSLGYGPNWPWSDSAERSFALPYRACWRTKSPAVSLVQARPVTEISATLDILTRLIAFDTTSRNSNLAN